MKIKNILKRCVATALAAAIGMSALATGASAATTGISIGYTWNSSVNPTISGRKNAVSGGVSGQYIKSGEQICRFVPSSGSDWAFCIEPAKSMQGSNSGTWYTQYGFTEYDTFDLTDKNKADSYAYWKSIGGTDGAIAKYMGLVQYYGYSSHKTGDYYAATQLLIWELILGYRGHTRSTFGTCSDVLWNDFTYPSSGWCTKAGVEKAYNKIVSNVKSHYKLPGAMASTKAQAKEDPHIMKFHTDKMRYSTDITIPTSYVTASSLAHNFSTFKSKLENLVKSSFTGTYGTDYGIDTSTSGSNTVYTVWTKERQFTTSIYVSDAITMQMKSDLKKQETLFANSTYQTCLLSTRLDPMNGYVGIATYNEPNLTVEKTYTDSSNNQITATALSKLLDKTTFVISTTISGTKYYVKADKSSAGNLYVFTKYVTSVSEATKFKTLKNSSSKGTFTVNDLPTSISSGRTYTVTEYSVPDNGRYEKLSKSVTLPSPTSDFATNAGTKTVKMNNTETGFDAKFGTATLDKIIENGAGKTLSSDDESNIASLANIYKSTKFIVGYWDGTTVRYLANGYTSARSAFNGDLADLDNFTDVTYKSGDGMYYVSTKLDSDHNVIFDPSRTTTDMSKAYVFSTGHNYSGTDTCGYFGEVFLNLLPLDSNSNSQEIFFVEVNGSKGYSYDESLDTSKAINLSELGNASNKRGISGLVKNDTSSSYTVTDENGGKYVIASGKYYPICGNKLESNRLHSDAEIINQLTSYELVLTKKDDSNTVLPGAKYGLYNSSKKLLKSGTTGSDGKLRFDYDLLPNTDYYVKEITPPVGYVLDETYYKINRSNTIVNDTDTFENAKLSDYSYEVKDKPYELKIEVNKYDVINNVKVEGIEFDVSLNGKTVGTMTTNADGYACIEHLPLGKLNGRTFENVYVITEKKNDKYIMIDEDGNANRTVTVTTTIDDIESSTDPVITYTCDIPNTLQTVDLKVRKVDEYGNAIKGATFDIYPTSDISFNGKTIQKANEKIGTLTTDANGVASTSYIEFESDGTQGYNKRIPIYPNFEYALKETYVPAPYVIPSNNTTKFTAISETNDTLRVSHEVTVPNKHQRGILDVYKQDGETKKPLAGAEFEVRAAEDFYFGSTKIHSANDLICTMTTGADGHAASGDAAMYVGAKYTLTETKAADGYVLKKDSRTFEFSFAGSEAEYSKLDIDFDNTTQQGKISIHKTGDIFSSVTALGTAISIDEDGTVHEEGYNIFTPVFAIGELEGATFEVKAVEDIVTADGTVRAKVGDVVAAITTDKNGYAETGLLYLGKYEVTETQAAAGYVINRTSQIAELTYAGQEVEIRDTVKTDFTNKYQGVSVHLNKFMEHDEQYNVGGNEDAVNVVFGLYADEDISAADGSLIPANGLVSVASVDENMTANFNEQIPFGRYYIQEISTDEKYVISGEKHIVTFEYAGQDTETVDIDGGEFVNKLKRGSVHGIKVDEYDEPLANAVFGIFHTDCEVFNAENAIATATSDENGVFEINDIPYGSYIVTEIQAPSGYVFSDKRYDVVISEDGDVVEITAVNNSTKLSISKQDVYGKELPGASMQLLDSEGNVFDEWVSDGTNHVVTNLSAGSYTLHEVASPDGYVIATDIIFEIDEYNTVTINGVETQAFDENSVPTIIMIDDTTKVHISKTDITGDKELPGAKLQIIDENGEVVDEWISTDEGHIIEGKLTAGKEYILHEEIAPDGYVVANDIAFTISEDGSIDTVIMKDDTTKVKISKRDITTDEELPGAKLIIIDENGEVVEEWISTTEAHYIEGKLISGKTYTLREITAPDGYEIASDVTFTVNKDGSVAEVVMYDEHTPTATPPTTPPTTTTPPSTTPNPHTGMDDALMNGSLAMMAVCGFVMVAAKRKKEQE